MFTQRKILVVEDNEINRMMLSAILSSEYEVLEAENGQAALAVLRKYTHSVITCCNLQSCQSQALRKRRLPVLHQYPAVRKAPERKMRIQSRRTGYGLPQL